MYDRRGRSVRAPFVMQLPSAPVWCLGAIRESPSPPRVWSMWCLMNWQHVCLLL